MFSAMAATLILAGVVAGIVFVSAFAAEGRGERLVRMLLGAERMGTVREHLFDELERPAATLDLLGDMSRTDARDAEVAFVDLPQPATTRAA